MNKPRLVFLTIMLLAAGVAMAINFGGSSPDAGEADGGNHSGTFATLTGNFTNTRTDDNIYFGVGRLNSVAAAANQTLEFNVSILSSNASMRPTAFNVTVKYCHAKTIANICNNGSNAEGTNGSMNIFIFNFTNNKSVDIGNILATTTSLEITVNATISVGNLSDFINSQGFMNISFEFIWNGSGDSAFLNDFTQLIVTYDTASIVTLNSPANNTIAHPGNITFNCSATDDRKLFNITLYHNLNGTFVANETNTVGGTSNSTTFTLINVPERVDGLWNCLANDGNLSSFASANFSIDTSGLNITETGCVPSKPTANASTVCNASIIDNAGVSIVQANVTLPNGSVRVMTITNISSNYSFNITEVPLIGRYNVTWIANDTNNNIKTNTSGFFIIGNSPPTVSLISPVSGTNTSNNNQTFSFNVTDEDATLNCSLLINGLVNVTQANTTANISQANITAQSLGDGQYNWTIQCTDSNGSTITATARVISIDTAPPNFNSLETNPDDSDGLDPNATIVVTANITDNTTAINNSLVFLEIKLSTESTFTQVPMTFNTTTGLYNATINQSTPGTYNLRLNATDVAGIAGVSTLFNITLEFERTWIDTPDQLVLPASNFSRNGSVLYTINNTGDFTMRFNITSNYSLTFFNETPQFNLAAAVSKSINVTATAGNTTLTRFTLNTSAVDAADTSIAGAPASRLTNATVVVAPNQPILVATITTAPIEVTQGDIGVTIVASLENVGEGNASNVNFNITLPSGWSVTAGNPNLNLGNHSSGAIATTTLEVRISQTATTGNQIILANASGQNATGANLDASNLIFADTRTVSVFAPQTLGSGSAGAGAGAGGGGAGGGGAAAAAASSAGYKTPTLERTMMTAEFLETRETIEVIRSEQITFPLKVTNVFENTTLSDVRLKIRGYLSQYLSHEPEVLKGIIYKYGKVFTINVTAPGYFTAGTYNLTFVITGKASGKFTIVRNATTEVVNALIDFTEKRNVTLVVYEMSPEKARALLAQVRNNLNDIAGAGLPLVRASAMLEQIEDDYANLRWHELQVGAQEFQQMHDDAMAAHAALQQIQNRIEGGKKIGVDVTATETVVELIMTALNREDFSTARKRAEEGLLIEFLEVSGAFSFRVFLLRWWWALLLGAVLLSTAGYLGYRMREVRRIDLRVQDLLTEEIAINQLINDAQIACFEKKTISVEKYHQSMYAYEKRLEKIKHVLSRLRARRLRFGTPAERAALLQKEKQTLEQFMKLAQHAFFVEKTISQTTYEQRMEEYKTRMAELEEENVMSQAQFKAEEVHAA